MYIYIYICILYIYIHNIHVHIYIYIIIVIIIICILYYIRSYPRQPISPWLPAPIFPSATGLVQCCAALELPEPSDARAVQLAESLGCNGGWKGNLVPGVVNQESRSNLLFIYIYIYILVYIYTYIYIYIYVCMYVCLSVCLCVM